MANWEVQKAIWLEDSHIVDTRGTRILKENGFWNVQKAILIEDSHCRCGRTMKILKEKCFPDVPGGHLIRGFSFSLRTDNENPQRKLPSGGASRPF